MTEDEAMTKWCPFARNLGTLSQSVDGVETIIAHGTQNRGYQMGGALHTCLCIGSACMAWRWSDPEPQPGFVLVAGPDGQITVRKPTAAHYGWPVLKDLSERRGFCGLAGAPS